METVEESLEAARHELKILSTLKEEEFIQMGEATALTALAWATVALCIQLKALTEALTALLEEEGDQGKS